MVLSGGNINNPKTFGTSELECTSARVATEVWAPAEDSQQPSVYFTVSWISRD